METRESFATKTMIGESRGNGKEGEQKGHRQSLGNIFI